MAEFEYPVLAQCVVTCKAVLSVTDNNNTKLLFFIVPYLLIVVLTVQLLLSEFSYQKRILVFW